MGWFCFWWGDGIYFEIFFFSFFLNHVLQHFDSFNICCSSILLRMFIVTGCCIDNSRVAHKLFILSFPCYFFHKPSPLPILCSPEMKSENWILLPFCYWVLYLQLLSLIPIIYEPCFQCWKITTVLLMFSIYCFQSHFPHPPHALLGSPFTSSLKAVYFWAAG